MQQPINQIYCHDAGLAIAGMPSRLNGAAAKAYTAGITSNLQLAQAAAQALGDVPLFLSPAFVKHGPDERAVVLFVAYLCFRVLDVSKEDRAAQTIQSLFRKKRAQQPGATGPTCLPPVHLLVYPYKSVTMLLQTCMFPCTCQLPVEHSCPAAPNATVLGDSASEEKQYALDQVRKASCTGRD